MGTRKKFTTGFIGAQLGTSPMTPVTVCFTVTKLVADYQASPSRTRCSEK